MISTVPLLFVYTFAQQSSVTIMVLEVDLQCHKCYKKVKKVLCKFPREIRDQIYNEKQNQVVIKVVGCNPEKIRDKICCKGGSAIKSIEIKEPEKSKPPKDDGKHKGDESPKKDNGKITIVDDKKKSPEKDNGKITIVDGKKKSPEKDNGNPPIVDSKPKKPVVLGYPPPVLVCCIYCYLGHAGGPCYSGCGRWQRYNGYGGRPCNSGCGGRPCNSGCGGLPCYSGCGGQPCHSGYGGRPALYIQYDGHYGRPVYDNCGGENRGYCVTRNDYFSEENPSSCTFM